MHPKLFLNPGKPFQYERIAKQGTAPAKAVGKTFMGMLSPTTPPQGPRAGKAAPSVQQVADSDDDWGPTWKGQR